MDNTQPVPKIEPTPNPQQQALKLKVLGILVGIGVIAAAVVAVVSLKATKEVMTGIAQAFRPQTKYGTILTGTIGQLNNNPKLVVLTADVTGTVIQENTTTFAGVTVGSATVTVSVPARVQYYVPMNLLTKDDFTYDAQRKRLVVSVQRPRLDRDIIDLDPSKITAQTQYGYSPLSLFKGKGTRDDAIKHLKEAALSQGENELLGDRAEKNAKKAIADQLAPVAELLQDGVVLDVEFKK